MANEFKIRKGLIVEGATSGTVVDVQGSKGQLFSVTDNLSGSIFAVSDISGVPILDVNSSGLSTFAGNVTIGSVDAPVGKGLNIGNASPTIQLFDTTYDAKLLMYTQDSGSIIGTYSNHALSFFTNSTQALEINTSQNATFAGDIVMANGKILYTDDIRANSGAMAVGPTGTADLTLRTDSVTRLTIDSAGDATFTEQAFSSATSSGDASSTLTTKGYVDGLITGATIYRGAWDPSGGGYGSPDLSGVTQTSGYYYICSAAGTAEPNGTGTEPDSWEVGDWVIYNDVSGTGQWQKIDNSSVLSGVGTGQTVALWEGADSVTDSETLGNAPITVSGNNTTFGGAVTVNGFTTGTTGFGINYVVGATVPMVILANAPTYGIFYRESTPDFIEFKHNNVVKQSFDGNGNADFAGTVTSPTFLGDLNGTINTATTGTTQTAGNNSTKIATTAYADAAAAAVPIGNYLPLSAGASYPLTDTLYVRKNGNKNNGNISMGLGGSGTTKWSFLTGTHYNQATGSGNGSGSAGMAIIGSLATETFNKIYIGGGPYEINAATQIDFWTHSGILSTAGGTRRGYVDNGGNWFLSDTLWVDNADEYVGIGTTTPGSKLEVNVIDDGFDDIDVLRLKRTWATGSGTDRAHGILFNDLNSRMATIYADRTNSGSNYNSQLLFSVNSGTSGTSMITPMVINNLGRVGIGTTGPTSKLEVIGTATINASVNSIGTMQSSTALNSTVLQLSSTYEDNMGQPAWNVSSGSYTNNSVTAPDGTTTGTSMTFTTTSWDLYYQITGLGAADEGKTFKMTVWLKLGTATNFVMTPNNGAWNTLDSRSFDADDGLNTTTWVQVTHKFVYTAGGRTYINFHIGANTGGAAQTAGTVFAWDWQFLQVSANDIYTPNIKLDGITGNDSYLNAGNVGIGTTTPNAKLDIQGTQGQLFSVTDDLSGEIFAVADISGVPIMAVNSSGVSYFDGKVFINASASIPNRPEEFQVTGRQIITNTGTNSAALYLGYNSSGSNTIQLGRGRTADGLSYIDLNGEVMSAGDYGFRIMRRAGVNAVTDLIQTGTGNLTINAANGADTVFINTNVGIGTTSPQTGGGAASWLSLNGTAAYSGGIAYTIGSVTKGYSYFESGFLRQQAQSGFGHKFIVNGTNQAVTILSSGNVGIGDTTPSYKLDVAGTIRATGDVIAYSDARVKENIKTIDNALNKIDKLRGVEFNKIGEDIKSIGVIAQEIEKVIPEVVREDDKGMKSVAYGNISGLLIEAIKELKAEIDLLKSKPCTCNKCNCNI